MERAEAERDSAMSKILTKAEDIRQWAEARGGYPLLMDVPSLRVSDDAAGGREAEFDFVPRD